MNTKLLWNSFLEKIKNEISPAAFEAWFLETELYELKDGTAKVSVPMSIQKKSLKNSQLTDFLQICFLTPNLHLKLFFYNQGPE